MKVPIKKTINANTPLRASGFAAVELDFLQRLRLATTRIQYKHVVGDWLYVAIHLGPSDNWLTVVFSLQLFSFFFELYLLVRRHMYRWVWDILNDSQVEHICGNSWR
ncbi:uncharacterized protein J3R85_011344 [Psidium guajava]|nr:uncharacterized protein J3R85_011344 [Psidium guajava]